MTGRAVTVEHTADVDTPVARVRERLVDPGTVARCVPGAVAEAVDGATLRGWIRIKATAVPVRYNLEARLTGDDDGVELVGHVSDRTGGPPGPIRVRVSTTELGPGRTRCRLTVVRGGAAGAVVIDERVAVVVERLFRQFLAAVEEAGDRDPGPEPDTGQGPGPEPPAGHGPDPGTGASTPEQAAPHRGERLPERWTLPDRWAGREVLEQAALVGAGLAAGALVGGVVTGRAARRRSDGRR